MKPMAEVRSGPPPRLAKSTPDEAESTSDESESMSEAESASGESALGERITAGPFWRLPSVGTWMIANPTLTAFP